MIYLITKCVGDDGSDITGCLLAISAEGMADINKGIELAAELSNSHQNFSTVSFTSGVYTSFLAGVEIGWLADCEWEDTHAVGAEAEHVFIKRQEYERLQQTARPDWRIGSERIVFNEYGDSFIEGSYEGIQGCESSSLLPVAEIVELLLK